MSRTSHDTCPLCGAPIGEGDEEEMRVTHPFGPFHHVFPAEGGKPYTCCEKNGEMPAVCHECILSNDLTGKLCALFGVDITALNWLRDSILEEIEKPFLLQEADENEVRASRGGCLLALLVVTFLIIGTLFAIRSVQ